MSDVAQFREHARNEILARDGGLISADISPNNVGIVVAKYAQEPSGVTFEGVLVFSKNDTWYRATVTHPETGTTGMREAVILDRHLASQSSSADPLDGWMRDPYDPSRTDPFMRSVADSEEHDSRFPKHPLTLLRAELRRLEHSL